jgi:outer membrane immunogenic protein
MDSPRNETYSAAVHLQSRRTTQYLRIASPTLTEKEMTNRLVSAVAAAALMAGGAFAAQAADLPTRKEAPAPVFVPPPFTWTGFYVGANTGGLWSTGSRSATLFVPAQDIFLNGFFPNNLGGSNNGGWIIGGQAGYNYQWGAWVLGAETDLDWTSLKRDVNFISAPFAGAGVPAGLLGDTLSVHARANLDWIGTTRARLGFVVTPDNRLMIYGTGGVAYGGGSSNFSVFDATRGIAWAGNPSSSRVGWTLGAGAEYAITNNITIRGEYLYMNLGSRNITTVGNLAAATLLPGVFATAKVNYDASIFRAAINYKF